ncbi:MAG: DUF1353 domain-containing protein [Cyanobacteria bacterium P01_C01_bin.89]
MTETKPNNNWLCGYKYPYDDQNGFQVGFQDLPSLTPKLLPTSTEDEATRIFEAWRGASARRLFKLNSFWEIAIQISQEKRTNQYSDQDLSGTIVIPIWFKKDPALEDGNTVSQSFLKIPEDQSNLLLLDGASVPLPWLFSFLSFGLLRPLGVMLTASIVHDFAFEYGGLIYREQDESLSEEVLIFKRVSRDLTDQLFRDLIATVNEMRITAFLAWIAVRLGWYFVKYDGKPRGGDAFPWTATIALIAALSLLGGMIVTLGLEVTITAIALLYSVLFVTLKLTAPPAEVESTRETCPVSEEASTKS